MPDRNRKKQQEAQKLHYLANKNSYLNTAKKHRAKLCAFINEIKNSSVCICGEYDVNCLDFHHRDQKNKLDTVCNMVQRRFAIEAVSLEIAKCDILCVNCHRKLHWQERLSNKQEIVSKVQQRRRLRAEWFWNYKKSLKCQNCDENHPVCLDFHHKEPNEKYLCVSELVGFAYSINRIIEEIDKCLILCGNCHRKHHGCNNAVISS